VEQITEVIKRILPGLKPVQSGPGEGWATRSCFFSDGTGLYWVTQVADTAPWRKVSSHWMRTFSNTIQTAGSVYIAWDENCRITFWCGLQAKPSGTVLPHSGRGGKR
jgi:hypothetical protein